MARGYEAGRVYVQVVPSYRNFQNALRQAVRGPLGSMIEQELKGVFDNAGKEAGRDLGHSLAEGVGENDAFTREINKKLNDAEKALGRSDKATRQRIQNLRKDLISGKKDADSITRAIRELGDEMYRVSRSPDIVDPRQKANAEALSRALLGNTEVTRRLRQEQRAATADRIEGEKRIRAAENASALAARRRLRATRDANAAQRGLGRITSSFGLDDVSNNANSFRTFSGLFTAIALAGAAVMPVLAGVSAGIIGLAGIAASAGVGLGVFALALNGIGDAVKALGKQEDAASASSVAYQRQVRNAARGVERAQRQVGKAQEAAAKGVTRALERQRDAERRLAQQQARTAEAQRDLTQARLDAITEIRDLENSIAQNRLDERRAVISLYQAQQQYNALMNDPGSSNLEREEASIALEQARLDIKRTREEQEDLGKEKAKIDRYGVEGTERVIAAQQSLIDAVEAEKEARRDLAMAAAEVDEARIEGAERVAEAMEGLRDAQENYNDALQGSASAIDEVNRAFENLSPAARRFALWIYSLKDDFYALRAIAAEGFLPGLQSGLMAVMDRYAGPFADWLDRISRSMGQLAEETLRAFTNDHWAAFFSTFGDGSIEIIESQTRSFQAWSEAWATIFRIATPFVVAFSEALADLAVEFRDWTRSEQGQESIRGFMQTVFRIGEQVWRFVEALAGALSNLGKALMPIGESVLGHLTDFLNWLAGVDHGKIQAVVAALASVFLAVQAMSGLNILATALATLLNPVGLILLAVTALAAAFFFLGDSGTPLGEKFGDLLDRLKPLWEALKDIAEVVWDEVIEAFNTIKPGLEDIIAGIEQFANAMVEIWGNIWEEYLQEPLENLWMTVEEHLLPAFNTFAEFFREVLVPIMIWVAETIWEVLGPVFSFVIDAVAGLIKIFSGLIDFLVGVFTGDWQRAWDGIKAIFGGVWDIIKSLFSNAWEIIKSVFSLGVEALTGAANGLWTTLEEIFKNIGRAVAAPILKVIEFVINDGVIDAVRTVQGWIGVKEQDKLGHVKVPQVEFANGGIYGAVPGYTPGRDPYSNGQFRYSGGEAIMRPEWTAAVGPGFVNAMNEAARRGGKGAVRDMLGFANGGVFWPANTRALSPNYRGHTGVDIRAAMGSPIFAAAPGIVTAANRWGHSYGHHIRIAGFDGFETIYAHLSQLMARVGQLVMGGELIGHAGSTGNSTGPHLHFEVRPGGTYGAALAYLNGAAAPPGGFNPFRLLSGVAPNANALEAQSLFERVGSGLKDFLSDPVEWLKSKASQFFDKIGGGTIGDIFKQTPLAMLDKATGAIIEKVKSMFSWLTDNPLVKTAKRGWDFTPMGMIANALGGPGEKPNLYDNGGWLPPGLSTVYNATGRPEPILTGEQWDAMLAAMATRGEGGGDTYVIQGAGLTADELAAAIERRRRRHRGHGAQGKGRP